MDEGQLFFHPADPATPLKRSTTDRDVEFVTGQIAKLAKYAFMLLFVGAVLGIVGIQAFWRYVPACGS
jgi:hypothetical protein